MRFIALLLLGVGFLPAAHYQIDDVHTYLSFEIMHLGVAPNQGRFNTTTGSFSFDPASGDLGDIRFTIPVASIDTNNVDRDNHLKSPDFFNAEEYPEITFVSSMVERDGKDYQVTGELAMHGTVKNVTIPVRLTGTGEGMQGEVRAGFAAVFTVQRSEYGVDGLLGAIGDDVTLRLAVEGVQQE